jgi:ketosteroid isomerase-like protein
MMKHGLVLLLWLSTTFAYAQAASGNHAADEQAISRLNEQLLKAYNLGDVNTLERIEDADFLVAGGFGEVSKSQQLDDVRHRKDNPTSVALTVSNPRFRFYGDTALLTEVEKYGSPANEPGFETTSLWVRRGGEWKVVHLHFSQLTQKP